MVVELNNISECYERLVIPVAWVWVAPQGSWVSKNCQKSKVGFMEEMQRIENAFPAIKSGMNNERHDSQYALDRN